MVETRIAGRCLVAGTGFGPLLVADMGLSFWGGVDPASGNVIDQHHPLRGQNLSGCVLAIPGGRGSCSGSGVLLELIMNKQAPAALVFTEPDEILTLGVLAAQLMFKQSIPVLCIDHDSFSKLNNDQHASVVNDQLIFSIESRPECVSVDVAPIARSSSDYQNISLSSFDKQLLDGDHGKAAQAAMHVLLSMAKVQRASELIDVNQVHIDACVYNGPAGVLFVNQLADWGGRVRVPTTLNAISVDKRRWRQQGVDPSFGEPANALADGFIKMGAVESFTCAPYLLNSAPLKGEQIAWGESNAVAYANSVLGARTQKYPDFLDVCIALTGRAPKAGSHLDQGRVATVGIVVPPMPAADDAFWPLLGYHIGNLARNEIPIIHGLEDSSPSNDDLKALSAAFATTASAPMFHIRGITPEASSDDDQQQHAEAQSKLLHVTTQALSSSWLELNSAVSESVDLVCFGNPHFSLSECIALANLCAGRTKHPDVGVLITMGRAVHHQAVENGAVTILEQFGVEFITDTCWCMIEEPIIPASAQTLMTNSGKYAHYAPGLVGRQIHFGSLADCVAAACSGKHTAYMPDWLT